jgi:tetratricopeptide (TPR) repeat protein
MKPYIILLVLAGSALLILVSPYCARRANHSALDRQEPLLLEPARTPRLPAPRMAAELPAAEPVGAKPAEWISALLKGEWPARPTPEQLEPFLNENRRSAESLLAAFRATDDPAYLREATETYPDHPHVAFAALFRSQSPEETRHWIKTLQRADPNNALADYLAARDYFNAGEIDQAVRELVSASGKTRWQDYSGDFIQNAEEAYRAVGCSEAEAKTIASLGLPLPHLAQLRNLGQHIGELAGLYRQAGDDASAQAALQMGVVLAQRISQGSGPVWLIQDMVSLATEQRLLEGVDPAMPYDAGGRRVKDRIDEITAYRDELKQWGRIADDLLQNLAEPDLVKFLDRWKVSGELAALRWALNRQGGE